MIPNANRPASQALPDSTALSPAQLAATKTLITTHPRYSANATATPPNVKQICADINARYTTPNAGAPVPVRAMPKEAFLDFVAALLQAVNGLPDTNAQKPQILAAYATYQPIMTAKSVFDLTNPIIAEMLALIVDSGAMTQTQMNVYSTTPLPPIQNQPDAFGVVGQGAALEIADIASALAS